MGIYFDFKKRLLMEFEAVVGRRVGLSDLTFGVRRDAPQGSGYDSLIDVTCDGITRGFVYNRTPLDRILLNFDKALPAIELESTLPTGEEIMRGVLDTYGIELDPNYFDYSVTPVGRGLMTLTARSTNPIYTGSAFIVTKTELPPGTYRQPEHEWLFDNNLIDTGTEPYPMPGAWSATVVAGKTFMSANPAANIGPEANIQLSGDFTLDFEIAYAAGGGYAYLFGIPGFTTRGAYTFYASKLYHYLITPSSVDTNNEWYKKMPPSDGTPIRYTIVSIGGYEHWFINGKYLNYSHSGEPSAVYLLRVIQANLPIRNLRYWHAGLFNSELAALFGSTLDEAWPDHWFEMIGNGFNKGLNSTWSNASLSYVQFEGETWAQPYTFGTPMGAGVDLNLPFTLQLDLVNQSGTFAATEGLFSDANLTASGGALQFLAGNLMFVTGSAPINCYEIFADKRPHTITLQGDGTTCWAWIDDIFLGAFTIGTKTTLTHIGKAGVNLTTNWLFRNLKIWTSKVPIDKLRAFSKFPKMDIPNAVVGLSSRSGDVALIDGDFNYNNATTTFNATYNPTAIGSFPEAQHGRYIRSMYYYFATDSTNWKKKILTWYIDVMEGGVWVNKAVGQTKYVSVSIPGRDVVLFNTPVYINPADPQIRIRGVGNWNDPLGYRWCTELAFLTSDLDALTEPEPVPAVRKPKYHYSFTGGSKISDGVLSTPMNLPIASQRVVNGETLTKLSAASGIDMGVDFPILGDFTLLFKASMAALPRYATLFSTSKTAQAQTGTIMFEFGKIYQVGFGYSSAVVTPPLTANVLSEIVLRASSGVLDIFIDGLKVHSYAYSGSSSPYRYIGDGNTFSDQWNTNNELGRIAYWGEALPDSELALIFSGAPLV